MSESTVLWGAKRLINFHFIAIIEWHLLSSHSGKNYTIIASELTTTRRGKFEGLIPQLKHYKSRKVLNDFFKLPIGTLVSYLGIIAKSFTHDGGGGRKELH